MGVDQAGQNEHLGLQFIDQLGLACRSFQELAAHQADTDGGADGAEAHDKTATQSDETENVFHDDS